MKLTSDQFTLRKVESMICDVDQSTVECEGDGSRFFAALTQLDFFEAMIGQFDVEHCDEGLLVTARGKLSSQKLARQLRRLYGTWQTQ